MSAPSKNPYRLLFSFGLLFGFWAAVVWVLFGFGISSTYPGAIHADMMIGGFLFFFAAGFLTTAVPRFMNSTPMTLPELLTGMGLGGGLVFASASHHALLFRSLSVAGLIGLALFCLTRFSRRKQNPPPTFAFVGVGLLCGILGAVTQAAHTAGLMSSGPALAAGRSLYYQGMMLSLILGVGGRLIPALLGQSNPLDAQHVDQPNRLRGEIGFFVGILILSFPIEAWIHPVAGLALRALTVTWAAFRLWGLHRLPRSKSRQARTVWVSAWSLMIGLWLSALMPSYSIHWLHMVFVSGFGLLTLMVATRVTLAHGGHDLILEFRSNALLATGALLLLAALTRVSAGFLPQVYLSHLAYAAICWIAGLGVWASVFLPKLLRRNDHSIR